MARRGRSADQREPLLARLSREHAELGPSPAESSCWCPSPARPGPPPPPPPQSEGMSKLATRRANDNDMVGRGELEKVHEFNEGDWADDVIRT